MEQRAGRGEHYAIRTESLGRILGNFQGRGDVGAPDISPVDEPEREHLIGGCEFHRLLELIGPPHEVEVNRPDGQSHDGRKGRSEIAEVCRKKEIRFGGLRQPLVDRLEHREDAWVQVGHQARFVDLDPVGTRGGQASEELLVDRHERRPKTQRLESGIFRLAEQEERDRAQQDRPRRDAQGPRLRKLHERLVRRQEELLPFSNSGTR